MPLNVVASFPSISKTFIRMTSAGLREAHPHDIAITEQAPNYRRF